MPLMCPKAKFPFPHSFQKMQECALITTVSLRGEEEDGARLCKKPSDN